MCVGNSINTGTLRIDEIEQDPAHDFSAIVDDDLLLFDKECSYLEPSQVKKMNGLTSGLRILHANIHSIPNKIDEFKKLLNTLKCNDMTIDIILLCETFINDKNKNQCFIENYQIIEEHRSTKKQGGVAIYINNKLKYKERPDLKIFKEGQFEACFVEIECKGKNLVVGEIYRVPGTCEKEFIKDYETLLGKLSKEPKDIVIGTDQNLDFLKIDRHENTGKFLELNLSMNILPTIYKPTRVTHSTATLIDNIYISGSLKQNSKSCILLSDLSDHFPCLTMVGTNTPEERNPLIFKTRSIKDETIEEIKHHLQNKSWDSLNESTTNDGYNLILEEITSCLDKYAPEKTIVIPYNKIIKEPWMTAALIKSSLEKDKLYKKAIGYDKNHPKYLTYVAYRNRYNSVKRLAKHAYYSEKIQQFQHNSKKLWNFLKFVIGKENNKKLSTDSFVVNEEMISDPSLISNKFCNFFSNVGKKLAESIPKSKKNFVDFMEDPNPNSLFLAPTDEIEIERLIQKLPNKSSSGFDGISNILLKGLSGVLKNPLAIVFNKSLLEGTFPNNMKISEVSPVYKAKDKRFLTNYRPISLLPVMSKVLEKVVYKRLYGFLINNNILYASQYGFRSKHSTVNAITEMIGKIIKGFEENKITLGVFLDLSKAFDTLEHKTLITKLENYGIRGLAKSWFESYLSERKLYVKYNNHKSGFNESSIEYGVPQGSVLGPLLYLVFCNDLYKCCDKCMMILFADDTNLFVTHEDVNYVYQTINKELAIVIDWLRANKLSLNLCKTTYVVFKPKNMIVNLSDLDVSFENYVLERVTETKFLGLFIDSNLNWNYHVRKLNPKLSYGLYILRNVRNCIPNWSKKILYYSYFHSHINYGLVTWGPMSTKANIKKLSGMQNKAVRVIDNKKYNSPVDPIFKKYKMLKFSDLIDMEISKMSYQIANDMLPNPVLQLFQKGNNFHTYNTRNRNNPVVAIHRSAVYNKSFLCRSPAIWNTLSDNIKSAESFKAFANRFKREKINGYL